jgi:hypothetical protein
VLDAADDIRPTAKRHHPRTDTLRLGEDELDLVMTVGIDDHIGRAR